MTPYTAYAPWYALMRAQKAKNDLFGLKTRSRRARELLEAPKIERMGKIGTINDLSKFSSGSGHPE